MAESLTDGIFAGQDLPNERLIDQSSKRRVFVIALIQVAAGDQACLHGLEIAGSDVVHVGQRDVARSRLRLAFHIDAAVGNVKCQRQAVDHSGSLNSRQGADLIEQAALKLAAALLVVALGGEIVGHDGGMLRARIQDSG